MITFRKDNNLLILIYEPDTGDVQWLHDILDKERSYLLKRTFHLRQTDLYNDSPKEDNNDEFDSYDSAEFLIGKLVGEYYCINKEILKTNNKVFLHKNIEVKVELFIATSNISIFDRIDLLVKEDIFIGGEHDNSLPEEEFYKLLNNFPNSYELKKYSEARVSVILRNYFSTAADGESKYNKYMNKRVNYIEDN
jgi:hypothetical protein